MIARAALLGMAALQAGMMGGPPKPKTYVEYAAEPQAVAAEVHHM